jgi:predicted DNA-binding helix-hairpin-helix protein
VFDIMVGDGSNTLNRPDKNYPLMPFTAAELNDFHIPMNFIKRNKLTQIVLIKGLQKKASDLMKLLQEKYKVIQE